MTDEVQDGHAANLMALADAWVSNPKSHDPQTNADVMATIAWIVVPEESFTRAIDALLDIGEPHTRRMAAFLHGVRRQQDSVRGCLKVKGT